MFWYGLLTALTVVFTLVGLCAFILFILSGCESPEIFLVAIVAGVIAFALGTGSTAIEKANTTTDTYTMQMEVTKCDVTSVGLRNGKVKTRCYLTVGDKYLIEVSPEEYAKINVGDIVSVEITTETRFGDVMNPTAILKG